MPHVTNIVPKYPEISFQPTLKQSHLRSVRPERMLQRFLPDARCIIYLVLSNVHRVSEYCDPREKGDLKTTDHEAACCAVGSYYIGVGSI